MAKALNQLLAEMKPYLRKGKPDRKKKTESKTSICALLFNGGCLVYSDLQASAGCTLSSTRQEKLIQIGQDRLVLAGTGSVSGIMLAAKNIDLLVQYWKSQHELEPITPEAARQILQSAIYPEDEASFLLASYDSRKKQGYIAEVFEDGFVWQSDLYQVNGSGSEYMLAKAKEAARKALSTLKKEVLTTQDVYQSLPQLNFPRAAAMLEGLDIINSGPDCDVFSGGEGYQLMVLDEEGAKEYIFSKELAQEIITEKERAEFSAINPQLRNKSFKRYIYLFEQGRRR